MGEMMKRTDASVQELTANAPASKVREVKAFFEDPQRYLSGRAWNLQLRAETVEELTRGIEYHSVLDIGCGDGSISIPLLNSGIRLTMLDLSSGMTRLARSRVPSELVKNVEFINQDFMQANIP